MTTGFDKLHTLNKTRRLVMATLATSSFDETLKAYEDMLGYQQIETGHLSADMATHWGVSELSGARLALMGPASGAPVYMRFLEIAPAPERAPSVGWFALELCVRDVDGLYQKLLEDGRFSPFAPPNKFDFTDVIYPMQCKGPCGEILYLNEVKGSLPDIDLPIAQSDVDHLFIAILSASEMDAANEFYTRLLDMRVNEVYEIPYKTMNRVHGLPLDTLHKLSTMGSRRQVALQVDQYPGLANLPKPVTAQTIVDGIFMVSFTIDELEAKGAKVVDPAQNFQGLPYNGARSVVCLGAANERMELIKL